MNNTNSINIKKRIDDIWSNILEKNQIDIRDDFFELGGNSLQAIRLLHEVSETFHVDLDMEDFLENPTVNHLVKTIMHLKH